MHSHINAIGASALSAFSKSASSALGSLKSQYLKGQKSELAITEEQEKKQPQFSVLSSENDINLLKEFTQKLVFEYTTAFSAIQTKNNNPSIQKVCDYIDEHLQEDISLEQMASYINVSSFYLSKLFKEEKGNTFVNFVADKRLEKAQQLLQETNLSIKEITAAIGYNDQNYFSRVFKNKNGLSPKEYRRVK